MHDWFQIFVLIFQRCDCGFQWLPAWGLILMGTAGYFLLQFLLSRDHSRGIRVCIGSAMVIHFGFMFYNGVGHVTSASAYFDMVMEIQQMMADLVINAFGVAYSVLALRYLSKRGKIAVAPLLALGVFWVYFTYVQILYSAHIIDCPTRMALELPLLVFALYIGIVIFVLTLAIRHVRAIVRIAKNTEK